MEGIDLGDKKQFEELWEDIKTYLLLHKSKGIEFSKEGLKKLSAEMLEIKKDPNDKDRIIYKFYRPLEALSLEVIEELTGLTGKRIRAVEVMLYLYKKKLIKRG